jgi:hypothetical protein
MLAAVIFLHFPFAIILLYCFTTDDRSYTFPPPGLTLQWFGVAWGRPDVWRALWLSVQVATVATTVALILGTLAAAAVYRSKFFGRDTLSLLLVLPLALPGIVTGIALRSALSLWIFFSRRLLSAMPPAWSWCIITCWLASGERAAPDRSLMDLGLTVLKPGSYLAGNRTAPWPAGCWPLPTLSTKLSSPLSPPVNSKPCPSGFSAS